MIAEKWPTELHIRDQGSVLDIQFDDGATYALTAEFLRVESPSAEVKGHGPGQEQLVSGKRKVKITKVSPIGTYAIRITFNDGHDTGLYTWAYLAELGRTEQSLWQAYLAKLQTANQNRDY
ncbi:MAG: DUF971 domain-containing protein [Alphaproteobacteria bacterium]|nr:DUF971 domain-containing protein [Alphaproteobacteria bacterium]